MLQVGRRRAWQILAPCVCIRYQQNLAGRKIAIVVLSTPQWLRVNKAIAGAYIDLETPFDDQT